MGSVTSLRWASFYYRGHAHSTVCHKMLERDLMAARDKWVEEAKIEAEKQRLKSDFLCHADHDGLYTMRNVGWKPGKDRGAELLSLAARVNCRIYEDTVWLRSASTQTEVGRRVLVRRMNR